MSGVPRLPPTKTFLPAALSTSPTIVVTVLLPLVPVMPMIGAFMKRLCELQFADHRDAARRPPRAAGSNRAGCPGW